MNRRWVITTLNIRKIRGKVFGFRIDLRARNSNIMLPRNMSEEAIPMDEIYRFRSRTAGGRSALNVHRCIQATLSSATSDELIDAELESIR
jgi:hypothetical protein